MKTTPDGPECDGATAASGPPVRLDTPQARGQAATIRILRTADLLRRRFGAVVEPRGVTLQQYNVLRILRGSHPEPLPTLEVAERMIERQPGITRLLDRLEGEGWVRRERCAQDRRRMHAWITDEGLALLADLDAPVGEADTATTAALDEAEVAELLRLLNAVGQEE